VELRHLEYFVAVADERHFTRAARRLHVAQSGLSSTIKTLESELGAPLLVRTTRRVELTPSGEALLVEARRTLAAARAAVDAVAAVEGVRRGSLAIGVMQAMALVDLAGLLARYRERFPGVELRLRQAGSADLVRLVSGGEIDLAFTSVPDLQRPGLSVLHLVSSRLVVACRRDDELAASDSVELSSLRRRDQVGFPPEWGARMVAEAALRSEGLEGQAQLEVNDVGTLLDLVEAGLGIAVLPEAIADLRPALHQARIVGRRWDWTISAVTVAPAPLNPAGRALWEMLAAGLSAPSTPSAPGD
jgi:DNA-binding transcriptional LysR family regulator